jgi:hypothetical protein
MAASIDDAIQKIHGISVALPDNTPQPDETVWVSVGKVDTSWRKDRGQYIGPGGSGPAFGDRYKKFGLWLERGEPVWIPWVGLECGEISFAAGGTDLPGCAITASKQCRPMSILPSPRRCEEDLGQANARRYTDERARFCC